MVAEIVATFEEAVEELPVAMYGVARLEAAVGALLPTTSRVAAGPPFVEMALIAEVVSTVMVPLVVPVGGVPVAPESSIVPFEATPSATVDGDGASFKSSSILFLSI